MTEKELLEQKIKEADELVVKYLPAADGLMVHTGVLAEAMNYAVRSGGKRLRPLIMLEVYRIFAGRDADTSPVEPFMAALEMIHCFSLVHDDMPEIDNDTLRRGKETTWKKYGSHMALLAGDALLNYAYETALSSMEKSEGESLSRACRALSYLASRTGMHGMIGGETADVISEKEGVPLEYSMDEAKDLLFFIHRTKTGALLRAAFVIGGILGGAGEKELSLLEDAALSIGVAFQIKDDILDVEGDEEKLGKNVGSDQAADRLTCASLLGLEESRREADRLCDRARSAVKELSGDTGFLEYILEFLIDRDY